jgi:hypothetical protein
VLIADLAEYHANTAMKGSDEYERLSTVLYFRDGIVHCGTPAEEWAKKKRRKRGPSC